MSFVSYAQNYEDVMLWRALNKVKKGTYVDIGAADPIEDSVTKLFYDNGWRGVSVEPTDFYHQRLMEERSDDINLKIAVSEQPGETLLYEIPGTGLTTTIKQYSEQHASEGGYAVNEIVVPSKTLNQVVNENNLTDIHFLKIDVEGAEGSVLRSLNFEKVRPWIVVVESMEPNSQISVHEEWEHVLLKANYEFVYSDGLNRFYLSREHSDLTGCFEYPPNIFDGFITHAESNLRMMLSDTLEHFKHVKNELETIRDSRSWKITRPLRWLSALLRRD